MQLQFHPTRRHVLLSGSTDGLVNIYDTTIADEDDVLLQVINHGSIHRAGFLSDNAVYALSHDEVFSIHPVTDPDSESTANDPSPIHFGDVRQLLSCQYVVQILPSSQGSFLAAGDTNNPRLDLFPLVSTTKWDIDRSNVWRLPGGHGPEIIRTVYLDEEVSPTYVAIALNVFLTVYSSPRHFLRAQKTGSSAPGLNRLLLPSQRLSTSRNQSRSIAKRRRKRKERSDDTNRTNL